MGVNANDVKFTRHALKRGKELGLDEKKLRNLLSGVKRVPVEFWRGLYKFGKYGVGQSDISFYHWKGSSRNRPLLYTINEEDSPVVITVTTKKKL